MVPALGAGFSVETANREEARVFFNSVYSFSANAEMGFTGNVSAGIAGTTDPAYREAVRVRVNWFRAMAGIPADIGFSGTLHPKCQKAALMMSANNQLDHTPPPSWQFYTADGAEAAANSNLYLGVHGPDAVTGYIEDPGAENAPLGHRRWILYPQTQTMGTGDVAAQGALRAANALWVFDANFGTTRPAVRDEFVAWPPPGHVPYHVVFPRWSFSYPNADFSNATVTLTRNGQALGKTMEPIAPGYGENTISWIPEDRDLAVAVPPAPAQDTVTIVTVNGVVIGGQTRGFTYSVRMFDPAVAGVDTVLATISGPAEVAAGLAANFACATVPRATGYDWEVSTPVPVDAVEGAEEGLARVIAETSAGYSVISTVHASGSNGFHFANPDFRAQSLELDRVIVPSATSVVQWQSALGWATAGQTARVQVSVDEGLTWNSIYSQSGSDTSGEQSFVSRSGPLAAYAGRPLCIRFLFDYRFGESAYLSTSDGVGWHVDDIFVTDAEELTGRVPAGGNAGSAFQVTPSVAGVFTLRARPVFFGEYPGEWAPVKRVDAIVVPASLTLDISPAGGGTVTGAATGTTAHNAGDEITLTAKPSPGFLFTGWTGGITSNDRTIEFLMPETLQLTANFIPNPWAAARGKFVGLVRGSPGSSAEAGLLTVVLDQAGAFSGCIVIGGTKRSFKGKFDATGEGTFGRAALPELDLAVIAPGSTLALSLDTGALPITEINATLVPAGQSPLAVVATRSLLTGAATPLPPLLNAPAEWVGRHTARISASVPDGAGPRGDGWALLAVGRNGAVTLIGKLADGTPITAGAKCRDDGAWPLYRPLYDRAGAIAGEIVLADLPTSDMAGSLQWFRPAAGSGRFSNGWPAGLPTGFSGSRYRRVAGGARVLSALDASGGVATVTAEFAASGAWPVKVAATGGITPSPAATDTSLRGFANPADGAWWGTFNDPAGTRQRYRGVVLQKEGIFAGHFLTAGDGGRIRLVP